MQLETATANIFLWSMPRVSCTPDCVHRVTSMLRPAVQRTPYTNIIRLEIRIIIYIYTALYQYLEIASRETNRKNTILDRTITDSMRLEWIVVAVVVGPFGFPLWHRKA